MKKQQRFLGKSAQKEPLRKTRESLFRKKGTKRVFALLKGPLKKVPLEGFFRKG